MNLYFHAFYMVYLNVYVDDLLLAVWQKDASMGITL